MTENRAQITIIVPVYNREKLVERTLQSIEQQTLRPLDVVLVDNNSSDNSLSVLQSWAEDHSSDDFRVRVVSEPTPGASAARNRGLELTETPYVMFFDSDDTMQPTLVQDYIETFKANPAARIVYTGAVFHRVDGKSRYTKDRKRDLLREHIYHASLRTQGYAAETEWVRRCGGWDPKVTAWDDWEFGIRLLIDNPQVAKLPGHPVDIYMQEESITGTDFSSGSERLEHALDAAERVIAASDRKDRKSLLRLIDYRRVMLAAYYGKEGIEAKAKALYTNTMRKNRHSLRMRLLMPIVYAYIRHAGRGLSSLVDSVL